MRASGVATLLTDAAGGEILEACRAAVVAWDGCLYAPPADRPVVRSVALQALSSALPVLQRPIAVRDDVPLLLVNAVVGVCVPAIAGRRSCPPDVLAAIRAWSAS